MRAAPWITMLVIAAVFFAVGHFVSSAVFSNDITGDLLELPENLVPTAAAEPNSQPVVANAPNVDSESPANSAKSDPANGTPDDGTPDDGTPDDGTPDSTAADAGGPAKESPVLKLSKGTVEQQKNDGSWVPLQLGEAMVRGQMVRVRNNSSASFGLGSTGEIQVFSATKFELRGAPGKQRFELAKGGLVVTTPEHDVRIDGPKKSRVVGRQAEFVVFAQKTRFGAISRGGAVELGFGRQKVVIPKDHASWGKPGKKPRPPFATSSTLMLDVNKPKKTKVDKASLVIKGKTHPLAEVVVNGQSAKVKGNGAFSAKIRLKTGANPIVVKARMIDGTKNAVELGPITRKRKAKSKPSSGVKWGK